MTTIFVYESCCALGTGREPADPAHSLYREGRAMRDAVADDFRRLPGIEVRTIDDVPASEEPAQFRDLATHCDWTLVIAPELGNELVRRCEMVEQAGGRLLGPGPAAVARTSSKLALARTWDQHGVPTPRTRSCLGWSNASLRYPVVLKPDDGAGSTATFRIDRVDDLPRCLGEAGREGYREAGLLVQEYCPGQPASVSFLVGPAATVELTPVFQHLSDDGRFRYQGGRVPIPPDQASRATELGRRAIACVPGLLGYVGVDLVLGDEADGSADFAIEINPRLTTSYVGLRQLAEFNLADALLRVAAGERPAAIRWKAIPVRFWPDGTVHHGAGPGGQSPGGIGESDYRF
jgi:predicted ATP-grasp superfamily ATP-dependent carboligase